MPTVIEGTGQKARGELDDALTEDYAIKLLLFGDAANMDKIFHAAKTRAEINDAREVVWIKDISILSDEEQKKYLSKGEIVACTVDLDGQPFKCYQKKEISNPLAIEVAYNEAQQS